MMSALLLWVTFMWLVTCERDVKSIWTLININQAGDTEIVAARESQQPPSVCVGHPSKEDAVHHVVVSYLHPVTQEECVIRNLDPRIEYHDREADDGGLYGGVIHHGSIQFAVTVHVDAQEVTVMDYKNPKALRRHFITQAHHSHFDTLAVTIDSTGIQASTIQLAGPTTQQPNLVFVSAGYTTAEQAKFDTDVAKIVTFLRDESADLSSMPFRRYLSMTNLFKVFHPSPQSGASHPAPAGNGFIVSNNLDCSYGTTSARILSCDRAKTLIVGSYAPPNPNSATIISIVNDPLFGGTGAAGIATTYSGSKMLVIFQHEMGHASASLADEYDYGYTEAIQVPMPNCYWQEFNTPWQVMVNIFVVPKPTRVCTYTNYFKPTAGTCLMESEKSEYCAVCKYNVARSMFDKGINLASPRFPSQYETSFIPLGGSVNLFVNSQLLRIFDDTGRFNIEWVVEQTGSLIGTNVAAVGFGRLLNGSGYSNPAVGSYTIIAKIYDRTTLFVDAYRLQLETRSSNNITSLFQHHRFRVQVYNPATTPVTCVNKTSVDSDKYCSVCDAGQQAACDLNFKAIPMASMDTVAATPVGLQTYHIIVGVVLLVLGIVVFIVIWRVMSLHTQHSPMEILPLTANILILRGLLLATQIGMLIVSTMAIVFSIYVYSQLAIFGRATLLGVVSCSVVTWFGSFLGFCSAYYKNRSALFANFILCLLLFICVFLFTVLTLYVYSNIKTDSVKNQLESEWKRSVRYRAADVCNAEAFLFCSGFRTPCDKFTSTRGTTNCPSNCVGPNRYADTCYVRVEAFVSDKFGLGSVGAIILTVLVLACCTMSVLLGWSLKMQRNRVHRERRVRHATGQNILSPEELAMLRREFNKIDRDGSGDLSRSEFSGFYNAVMGADLSPRELEEYFDKLDADGNGVLSFEEFIKVYVPHREPKRRNVHDKPANVDLDSEASDTPHHTPRQKYRAEDDGMDALAARAGEDLQRDDPQPVETQRPQTEQRQPAVDQDLLFDDAQMGRMEMSVDRMDDLDLELEQ